MLMYVLHLNLVRLPRRLVVSPSHEKMVGWCSGRIDIFDVNVCVALELRALTEALDLVKS